MLKGHIIGNLGADAERRVANGREFVSFRVAHSEKRTNRQTGEVTERTEWISCILDGSAGNLFQYLTKGTKLYVEGDLSARVYTSSRDGKTYAGFECRVRHLELCGIRQQVNQAQSAEPF